MLGQCQQTYAGSQYRGGYGSQNQGTAPITHTQSPAPRVGGGSFGPLSSELVPSRPLAQPRTPAPKPACEAVCVIDPRTGRILYGHNANVRRQVASTQKIITAL